jgi:hypothetical protein
MEHFRDKVAIHDFDFLGFSQLRASPKLGDLTVQL